MLVTKLLIRHAVYWLWCRLCGNLSNTWASVCLQRLFWISFAHVVSLLHLGEQPHCVQISRHTCAHTNERF